MSPVLLLLTSSLSALDIAQLAGDWTPDPEASWQAQLRAKPGLATATGDALAAERERMLRRCARSTFTLAADRIVIRVRRDDGSERSDIAALGAVVSTDAQTATATATPADAAKGPMRVAFAQAADGALRLTFTRDTMVEAVVLRRPTTEPTP